MISEENCGLSSASTDSQANAYHWFKAPDLNRATHRSLGKSGAGWTFETICRLVHHIGRVGRPKPRKAAKEYGRLSVGLQSIADEAGISVAKVRRDLVKLVDLGLVSVTRRNVTFHADVNTGRIVENRSGRSMPVVVFLTVGPEHCRTKAGQDRAANPSKLATPTPAILEGAGDHDRDHSGGGIQRERKQREEPVGDAVGIGTPPASAGGHSAAKAGQEGVSVRVDAPDDDLPPPVGRIAQPAGKAPAEKRRPAATGKPFQEDHREPQAFTGRDADRFAATRLRVEQERAAREAQDASWKAKREAQDDPARRLQEAVEALPDASRERADELGREYYDEAAVAADVQIVQEAIRAKVAAGAA